MEKHMSKAKTSAMLFLLIVDVIYSPFLPIWATKKDTAFAVSLVLFCYHAYPI